MFDVLVIGCGVSGMTASIYAARAGKKVLLLDQETIGGQISSSPKVENYPSIKSISGVELASNIFDQATELGVSFELEKVIEIKKDNFFHIKTEYNTYEAKSVIIATGVEHRKMNLPHEEELTGHGISYCAVCDGDFYRDKNVVVIGDANSALQYSLMLADICKEVTICTLFDKFFADNILVERLNNRKNVNVIHNLSLVKYNGDKCLESLEFKNTQTSELVTIPCDGVFIAIGQVPHNELFKDLVDLTKDGYIITNAEMETKTPGLFASGDCRNKKIRQLTTAIGDGAIASCSAINYLNKNE